MKLSNSRPSWKCGITTCQDSRRNIGTEVYESNQVDFCKSYFFGVMRWIFVDVKNSIQDKRPRLRNVNKF